ncbi:MAG: Hpt domain-containing protein [Candidatus Lokiarchaeota archaeon]|nr:Hpt domain-containing protein [Candidatus Lokiarchaeota archaeon]
MNIKELRSLFLEEFENHLDKLDDLLKEIQLESINQDKIKECKILFHTMKGDSGVVGAKNLYNYCALLEVFFIKINTVEIGSYLKILTDVSKELRDFLQKSTKNEPVDLEETRIKRLQDLLKF